MSTIAVSPSTYDPSLLQLETAASLMGTAYALKRTLPLVRILGISPMKKNVTAFSRVFKAAVSLGSRVPANMMLYTTLPRRV